MDISGSVRQCLKAFTDLEHHLEWQDLSSKSIQHEHARFRIWVGNLSAHRPTGRRSLEYRLRDSSNLRRRVITLLNDLCSELQESSSASIVDDDELEDNEEHLEIEIDSDEPTTSSDPAHGVRDIVSLLYRFSLTLRNPAGHSRIRDAIAKSNSLYLPYDIEHIREKFPDTTENLAHRLGKATSAKRQYLRYREDHHDKKSSGLTLLEDDRLETVTNDVTTVATPLPSNDAFLFSKSETETVYSMTSFAPTSSGKASLRPPPMPAGCVEGEAFQCPICFSIVSCDSEHAWRQHVFEYLPPYVCLEASCEQPETTYSRRRDWQRHIIRAHCSTWNCPFGCGRTHSTLTQARSHVLNDHSHSMGMSRLDALLESSRLAKQAGSDLNCVLCGQSTSSLQDWCRHVGHHLEQLALFALPSHLLGEDGDDGTRGSNLSDTPSSTETSPASHLSNTSVVTTPGNRRASISADSALAGDENLSAEGNNTDPGQIARESEVQPTEYALEQVTRTEQPTPVWDPSGIFNQWNTAFGEGPSPQATLSVPRNLQLKSEPILHLARSQSPEQRQTPTVPLSPIRSSLHLPPPPTVDPLPLGWQESVAKNGSVYYWTRSGETTWQRPTSPPSSLGADFTDWLFSSDPTIAQNLQQPRPDTSRSASAFAMDSYPSSYTNHVLQDLGASGTEHARSSEINQNPAWRDSVYGALDPRGSQQRLIEPRDLSNARSMPFDHSPNSVRTYADVALGTASAARWPASNAISMQNSQMRNLGPVGSFSGQRALLPYANLSGGPLARPSMGTMGSSLDSTSHRAPPSRSPSPAWSSAATYGAQITRRRGAQMSEGEHVCQECRKAFSRCSDLTRHAKVHLPAERRPHACHQCDKRFHYRKDLVRHLATHNPSRPRFFCPHTDCENHTKGLASKESLTRHMRSKHPL